MSCLLLTGLLAFQVQASVTATRPSALAKPRPLRHCQIRSTATAVHRLSRWRRLPRHKAVAVAAVDQPAVVQVTAGLRAPAERHQVKVAALEVRAGVVVEEEVVVAAVAAPRQISRVTSRTVLPAGTGTASNASALTMVAVEVVHPSR